MVYSSLVGKKYLYDIAVNSISINARREYDLFDIDSAAYFCEEKTEMLCLPFGCGSSVTVVVVDGDTRICFYYSPADEFIDWRKLGVYKDLTAYACTLRRWPVEQISDI